jgi:serine/threonine protein kinase
MSTATQACEFVLPGYTLVDRIGMGGYAEVWRAEAPGGIQKAVKLVHGYFDDEFASQELKALERIKGVRHPFLLSLERFEVINGRLAILTELADMSLEQRLRECRAGGLPGIPRDELLRYMSDAAEALDFLSQRHQLLHLDIKPENLLVLGDHIKVADFGLVKELATRTQKSLVSGMTPTYASPEMFDDEPTIQSDQYSLAIVYQEMLVGTLPFPGRTAAQLAKQHTQAEPQLASLPAADRPIIARALAKNPTDRFPSCRAFVDALLQRTPVMPSTAPVEAPQPAPPPPSPALPDSDDTKPQALRTTRRHPVEEPQVESNVVVTRPVQRGPAAAPPSQPDAVPPPPLVREEADDISVPQIDPQLCREQPTLYVAIGGVGIQVLCRLRALTPPRPSSAAANEQPVEAIAVDTSRDELREACSARWARPLTTEDTIHVPLRLPQSYDNSREILGWLSRRWLYNIPRSLETRGYRALGRVALVDHSQRVLALVDQKLQRLAKLAGTTDASGQPRDSTIRVVLLAGTGGGTGAGMVIDLANAARSLAAHRGFQLEVHGVLVCTCIASHSLSPLAAANTYSLLIELSHATAFGNQGNSETTTANQPFESCTPPFDGVYCVPAGARTRNTRAADALDNIARYLALESLPEARAVIRSCRKSHSPREQVHGRSLSLKCLGFSSLTDQKRESINSLAIELADAVKRFWVTKDTSADWERLVREEHQAQVAAATAAAAEGAPVTQPAAITVNESTPLALRGRFKEYMSLEFASEVLRHIQRQLEARDDRGRPLILARDAKVIADTARAVAASLVERTAQPSSTPSRFADSPTLCRLIAEGSRRVIGRAVEKFDQRQPERFLPPEAIDELIQAACHKLLEESLASGELAEPLLKLIDLDQAAARTMDNAATDLLQCGCDRRTLLFVPKRSAHTPVEERLRAARPLAASIPADVDDLVVVTESAGISPHSLAAGLERVFPGIADAARRLLTRIDIEWQSLS